MNFQPAQVYIPPCRHCSPYLTFTVKVDCDIEVVRSFLPELQRRLEGCDQFNLTANAGGCAATGCVVTGCVVTMLYPSWVVEGLVLNEIDLAFARIQAKL